MPSAPERGVALVTGAGRGIGRAVALELAGQGGAVVPVARTAGDLIEVTARIREAGGRAPGVPVSIDVRDRRALADLVARVETELGPVDTLVAAAGVARFLPVAELSDESWDEQIAINLTGAWNSVRAVLPGMLSRRRGEIVLIASVAAIRPFQGCAAYAAAKAGLVQFGRTLREEVREAGLRVTIVIPGATETGIWGENLPAPPERLLAPETVARAIIQALAADPRAAVEEIILRPRLGDLP